jgi:hypothetical protein
MGFFPYSGINARLSGCKPNKEGKCSPLDASEQDMVVEYAEGLVKVLKSQVVAKRDKVCPSFSDNCASFLRFPLLFLTVASDHPKEFKGREEGETY